ncbi:hypothetical protein [Streptomyces roseochromogenus]|uniref:Secreted protein n=1 Tax=Streptomyces roseochromogenus subsp. oscitans DS 12.976 TaxID=1352936 RepID=V6JMJ4_STRRC|nr:hypothetical protein [Streptomyces roseochromogenus]EST20321.1 hypothetical protein M878_39865 [Streptomyces roseochromogenus subsp. oscitans DS 12.976]
MKKRSMLAIATLATGFVVAAVTPSHAADKGPTGMTLGDFNVSDTLDSTGGHPVTLDSFGFDDTGTREK